MHSTSQGLIAVALIASMVGCASLHTDGTTVLHAERSARQAAPESVQLFDGSPKRPFNRVAIVTGYSWLGDIPKDRELALVELRKQAVLAGADGIVRVQQSVLTEDGVVLSAPWPGEVVPSQHKRRYRTENLMARLFQTRAVLVRGEAIRFR